VLQGSVEHGNMLAIFEYLILQSTNIFLCGMHYVIVPAMVVLCCVDLWLHLVLISAFKLQSYSTSLTKVGIAGVKRLELAIRAKIDQVLRHL